MWFFLIKAVMGWRESRTCTSHMSFSKKTTTKKKNDEGLSYSAFLLHLFTFFFLKIQHQQVNQVQRN